MKKRSKVFLADKDLPLLVKVITSVENEFKEESEHLQKLLTKFKNEIERREKETKNYK